MALGLTDGAAAFLPPGATYYEDVIPMDEQAGIVARLDDGPWSTALKRHVQHFGYRYDYKARAVAESAYLGDLPDWLRSLSGQLVMRGFFEDLPDQVIANEYLPGQGISAHVDCIPCFDDTIVSLSLLSTCEMVFRKRHSAATAALALRPRSVIVLKGAARYDWTHEIPARKSDVVDGAKVGRERRISLTFRRVIRAR